MTDRPAYTARELAAPDMKTVWHNQVDWEHAQASDAAGQGRLEIAFAGGGVVLRNTRRPALMLACSFAEWDIFARAVQTGEFEQFRNLPAQSGAV
ncbi:DUF397 domain-containing protein [Frankia sp. B2]|uniref:DUF397 domain-containing protein n=1 Tax=Frankia sp. B2 TaxID=2541730 RepID=UPI00106C896B|nr:DUF397 domain-containing protein [Frankia sp. B2]TFE24614.1 DUF397 domain-containing protein [Frankia sp. B2]